jgi:uncharacterized protein (DUF983 family)
MAQKSNSFISVLTFKCPKCHEGDLFYNKHIYQYKGFFDMPDQCPKCGQDFQMEPGFYFGAMYVSYALTIAINVAIFVALLVFKVYSLTNFFIVAGIVLLITLPYIFKISRSVWIAMMIKYDSHAIENYEAQH